MDEFEEIETRLESSAVQRSVHTLLKVTDKNKIDKILDYISDKETNGDKLSPLMKEQIERIEMARDSMHKHKLNSTVEQLLVRKYNYSKSTARRDIEAAQILFGAGTTKAKDWKRSLYTNWLEELARKSEIRGDYKSAIAGLKAAADLQNFDKEEPLDDDLLEAPPTMIITYDIESLGVEPIKDLEKVKEKLRYKNREIEEAEVVEDEDNS